MLGALEQGRADMAAITNPSLADALASGKIRTFAPPYRGIGKRLLIACWFCSDRYAKAQPEVVRKFATATRTATQYTNSHHAETVPLLASYAHLDPAVIGQMNRVQNATTLNVAEIQPAIDVAVRYNVIPTGFSASEFLL
jgi:NitT/TauT family transport system substrate-binding protein